MRFLLLLLGLFCFSAADVSAQIVKTNQKVQNRRALRDARKYPAPYKDSHLAVNKDDLKREGGGRSVEAEDDRDSYKFDNTGAARVSEPSYPALRLRKKKKDNAATN
ncbi:hypothetical protein [Hymenobacter sediminicola]|uniref:Uncharacterized protein n=1 Tax=Hymenobacter sediminicola TaxID=2761579 RepID=A0A7G7W894_9BACT|nr:hypothetical protein [Hymenobacter sediminicola]QNH62587.1 hypothetical protein H4317_01805 [Hymenobacter sediminicola]